MSYDIYLINPDGGGTIELDGPHDVAGGTYSLGGTQQAWLNITYNYGKHFYRVFGEKGIRTIYGMTGAESVPVIREAAAKLGDDVDSNYWAATEGNAKEALLGLIVMAEMAPHGVWAGD